MKRSLPAWLLLALLSWPAVAHASPWAPEPGHGYAKLWFRWLYGLGLHDGTGHVDHYGTYHEVFLATYGELGLFDEVAFFWHTDVLRMFVLDDPVSGNQGHLAPGDPAVGVRWQWLQAGRFASAMEVSIRAPLADDEPVQEVYGTAEGNPRLGSLRVGSGVWDFAMSLHAGYGWDRVYTSASVGHIHRSDGYDDVVTWTAVVGATFNPHWSGRFRLTGHHALRRHNAPYDNSPSGIGNGATYTGAAIEVEYMFLPDWWVGYTIEGSAHIVEPEHQTGGPVMSVFLSTRF